MRLTFRTDYALRVLIHLAANADRERISTKDISDAYGISLNHLVKVVHELGQKGFLELTRGRTGGVALALPPERISLGDVVRAVEPDIALVECFAPEPPAGANASDPAPSGCPIAPACLLQGVLRDALDAFFTVLDQRTLADLVHSRNAADYRALYRDAERTRDDDADADASKSDEANANAVGDELKALG